MNIYNEKLINIESTEETAEKIYDYSKDMDYNDYETEEEKYNTIKQLEEALYNLKIIAGNEYNKDYWRTLYNALQLI